MYVHTTLLCILAVMKTSPVKQNTYPISDSWTCGAASFVTEIAPKSSFFICDMWFYVSSMVFVPGAKGVLYSVKIALDAGDFSVKWKFLSDV